MDKEIEVRKLVEEAQKKLNAGFFRFFFILFKLFYF